MPETDAQLDKIIEELGTINVPSLISFLVTAHPQECPYQLAISTLKSLEDSSYALDFKEQIQKQVCAKCGDTSCALHPSRVAAPVIIRS